jgi:alanine racemase
VQVERYEAALAALGAAGIEPRLRHMAASSGLLGRTCPSYDMVRIGLAYYGEREPDSQPDGPGTEAAAELRPALTLKARAVRIQEVARGERVGYGAAWEAPRDSRIATLPLGYGDGYVRAYSPGASVLIREKRVPVVGRVSMDSLAVDVTDVPGPSLDDDVVLLGVQGDERITLDELAATRSSVNYEVIVGLGERLARVYRDADDVVAVSRPGSTVVVSPRASARWSTGTLARHRRG